MHEKAGNGFLCGFRGEVMTPAVRLQFFFP